MKVIVNLSSEDELESFDVDPDSTIADIKQTVCTNEGVAIDEMKLFLMDEELKGTTKIKDIVGGHNFNVLNFTLKMEPRGGLGETCLETAPSFVMFGKHSSFRVIEQNNYQIHCPSYPFVIATLFEEEGKSKKYKTEVYDRNVDSSGNIDDWEGVGIGADNVIYDYDGIGMKLIQTFVFEKKFDLLRQIINRLNNSDEETDSFTSAVDEVDGEAHSNVEKETTDNKDVRSDVTNNEEERRKEWPNDDKSKLEVMKRVFSASLEMDYPEEVSTRNKVLERIEEIVTSAMHNRADMEFIREVLENEVKDEYMNLNMKDSIEFIDLPWKKVEFKANSLERGSTHLTFSITFEEQPTNLDNVNVYRLMEMIILSIIENLDYIKGPKVKKDQNKDLTLTVVYESSKQSLNKETLDDIMKRVRGSLAQHSKDAENVVSKEKMIDSFLNKKGISKMLKGPGLTPKSQRDLIAKMISDMTQKDQVKFSIESRGYKKQNILGRASVNKESSTSYLFPYFYRKLSDIPALIFEKIRSHSKSLTTEGKLWKLHFVDNLEIYKITYDGPKIKDVLFRDADKDWPYSLILNDFRDRGGTIGGLLEALAKFHEAVGENTEVKDDIVQFIKAIEEIREEMYEDIYKNISCDSPARSIKNMTQFKTMATTHGLSLETINMQQFSSIQAHIRDGDQIWIYRNTWFIQPYAHVVMVTDNKSKVVHVTAPSIVTTVIARGQVLKDDIENVVKVEDDCFIVRRNENVQQIVKRAEVCIGLTFNYDVEEQNCETFGHGVFGEWLNNFQGEKIEGSTAYLVKTYTKLMTALKLKHPSLESQMREVFEINRLILPNEK